MFQAGSHFVIWGVEIDINTHKQNISLLKV